MHETISEEGKVPLARVQHDQRSFTHGYLNTLQTINRNCKNRHCEKAKIFIRFSSLFWESYQNFEWESRRKYQEREENSNELLWNHSNASRCVKQSNWRKWSRCSIETCIANNCYCFGC